MSGLLPGTPAHAEAVDRHLARILEEERIIDTLRQLPHTVTPPPTGDGRSQIGRLVKDATTRVVVRAFDPGKMADLIEQRSHGLQDETLALLQEWIVSIEGQQQTESTS